MSVFAFYCLSLLIKKEARDVGFFLFLVVMVENKLKSFQQLFFVCVQLQHGCSQCPVSEIWIRLLVPRVLVLNGVTEVTYSCFRHSQ